MEIYNYHPTTKDFLCAGEADESPLDPGQFLVPANATTIKPPAFNPATQTCRYITNKWIVNDIIVDAQIQPEEIDCRTQNETQLWKAASLYEQTYISGSALGTLTIGVLQGKPKSLEIKAWISNLWMNHYYPRKAMITGDAPIAADQLDFTLVGPMPYSVPELAEEVGV